MHRPPNYVCDLIGKPNPVESLGRQIPQNQALMIFYYWSVLEASVGYGQDLFSLSFDVER